MIKRETYLQELISFRDTKVIKVVTGIRRCGKSTLFQLYEGWLKEQGVAADHIIHINFEDLEFESLLDYKALYKYVQERATDGEMHYVFLDEIQAVPQYQRQWTA